MPPLLFLEVLDNLGPGGAVPLSNALHGLLDASLHAAETAHVGVSVGLRNTRKKRV